MSTIPIIGQRPAPPDPCAYFVSADNLKWLTSFPNTATIAMSQAACASFVGQQLHRLCKTSQLSDLAGENDLTAYGKPIDISPNLRPNQMLALDAYGTVLVSVFFAVAPEKPKGLIF